MPAPTGVDGSSGILYPPPVKEPRRFRVRMAGRDLDVEVGEPGPDGRTVARVEGVELQVVSAADGVILVQEADGSQRAVTLDDTAGPRAASLRGMATPLEVRSAQQAALDDALRQGTRGGDGVVRSPMPGRVVKVLAAEGATIDHGAALVIVEAMKMENEIHAPRSGRLRSVRVAAGDTVESGAVLCEIDEDPEAPGSGAA
jgi:biotin carboxyl carrier protein